MRNRCVAAVVLALLGAYGARPVDGDEKRDLTEASTNELAEILQAERPTPALTEAIRASRHRFQLGFALHRAVWDGHGDRLLNAVEHIVQLGMFSGQLRGNLSFLIDCEAAIEGSLRKIYHPDLHIYTVEMDVRRVHRGSITLTPENTPLRLLVSAMLCHARWIQIDWEPGTPVIAFAHQGEALFESRRLLVRGWTAWGGHVWKATGREEAILKALAPLGLKEPDALLEGMRSEDKNERWLSTVRTVMTCHGLGEPFTKWWSGNPRSVRLDRARLDPVRDEVIEAFEFLRGTLVWDEEEARFARAEKQSLEK